jgi:signal peptide peptidase SppA
MANESNRTTTWLGTEDSFLELIEIRKQVAEASPELHARAAAYDDEEVNSHWMVDVRGDVAVVNIVGPMEQGRAGIWGLWFGYVGYDDIKEALMSGAEQGATKFLLDWSTPGGSVAGISDMTEFLKDWAAQYEVVSFTSDKATSGGLWLATIADQFYATKMAQIGSVGVIAVHTEVKDMLDEMGITKTVFRTAPMKALGGPYEKLNEKSKASIEADINKIHEFFVDTIVQNLGLPQDFVEKEIATGEVWYGEEALRKGLINGIKTFKEVFVALSTESEENTINYQNSTGVDMKRKSISVKAAAAIAAGVPVDVALEDEAVDQEEEEATEAEVEPSEENPTEEEEPSSEASTDSAGLTQVVMDMTNQLVEVKTQLASAQLQLTQLQTNMTSMTNIVIKGIQHAQVALGSAPTDSEALKALDASVLVQQHAQLESELSKRYPVGGRVSQQVDESSQEDDATQALARHNQQVLMDLARFSKTK